VSVNYPQVRDNDRRHDRAVDKLRGMSKLIGVLLT